ncbi:MAG: hypothetical protein ABIP90_08435, partial [Vicinamibacterales bacterium]
MTLTGTARVVGAAVVVGAIVSVGGLIAQTVPPGRSQVPTAPPQASAAACVTATDPDYGLTANTAVQIGGGALYMAARERRYLDSLKGPAGQTLTYRRVGSTGVEVNTSMPIDMWEVSWDGAAKPITLYLLAYKYGEPKVPAGFTCSGFTLGNPPIDGIMAREQRTLVAVTQGASQDFGPVSLDTDGSAKSGIVFDSFRMIARLSRAATAAGKPLDPGNLPRGLAQQGLVVVAYPKKCGDRTAAPTSIDMGTPNGLIQTREPYVSGAGLA